MAEKQLDWAKLTCADRFWDFNKTQNQDKKSENKISLPEFAQIETRLPQERDHDRILFLNAFRRMADKTQVFPLEGMKSIRTRLTHSYEVANLARSVGMDIAWMISPGKKRKMERKIPAMLAAAGLAHDIGNPPFGHKGEFVIRDWFKRNQHIFTDDLSEQHKSDFLHFEGNAQTLRILTNLQANGSDFGANLSVGTLACVIKYVAASDGMDQSTQARKKVGYFKSEEKIIQDIRARTGLSGNSRHPLVLIMEACDDIAYSVLDIEDAVKKELVSSHDLLSILERGSQHGDEAMTYLYHKTQDDMRILQEECNIDFREIENVILQKFRASAIHLMITGIVKTFEDNLENIMSGSFCDELITHSPCAMLCRELKQFSHDNIFHHPSIFGAESHGLKKLDHLMDYFWFGISQRQNDENEKCPKKTTFANHIYQRISENQRDIFEGRIKTPYPAPDLPPRYKEMQLLTDMVSGMTDQLSIDIYNDFKKEQIRLNLDNADLFPIRNIEDPFARNSTHLMSDSCDVT